MVETIEENEKKLKTKNVNTNIAKCKGASDRVNFGKKITKYYEKSKKFPSFTENYSKNVLQLEIVQTKKNLFLSPTTTTKL